MNIKAPCENKEEIQYKPFCNVDPVQTTINFFNNISDSYSTNSNNELVGGNRKEWKEIVEILSQSYVELLTPHQDVEEMGEHSYVRQNLDVEKLKNPYIIDPTQYQTQEELFNAIRHWWVFKYRKNESTIKDRLRYAKKMAEHKVFPVNWEELNPNQIIAYLEYKEYHEYNNERGKHQILNEWKTVKTFAKAYGIDANLWGYIPPSPPKPKVKIIPLPNTTYHMIQHKYSKSLYKNALLQYIYLRMVFSLAGDQVSSLYRKQVMFFLKMAISSLQRQKRIDNQDRFSRKQI